MRIHKANYLALFMAGLFLAPSDREEMDRIEAGRDPVDVLTASAGDPTIHAITDYRGNVLAVGGHQGGLIWFVHTTYAESLSPKDRRRMLGLLRGHLQAIKQQAMRDKPMDEYHFTNIVSVENRPHLKLLSHLGATWEDQPFIHNGAQFKQFYF